MKIITLSFLISVLTYKAQAACGLSITANNVTVNWNLNFTYVAVQIQIDKANADVCDFGLGFTKGGAASYATRRGADGTKQIRYQLYKDNALTKTLKDNPDITSSDDVIISGFQAGINLSQTLVYYLEIPFSSATTPTLVPNGTYTDTFTINVYEGSDPLTFVTSVASANVTLTVNVPNMIGLSLVNSGGTYQTGATTKNMNFGTFAEGSAQAFDMRLRTNSGFSVTFSSANNGRMKHSNPLSPSYVNYSLYVNSVLLDLTNSLAVPVVGLSGPGQTATEGLAYPIRVVIGSLGTNALGGSHSDEITITATTTE